MSLARGSDQPGPFAAFRIRSYRLYFVGQMTSFAGTFMQQVALAWLVLDLTGSSVALGLVTAFQFAPVLAFSLTAGVLVDRLPKKRLLMTLQVAALLPATVLAILTLTGVVHLWHVYVLTFMLGCVSAFDNTTRTSFIANIVGRDQLRSAVSLSSTGTNLARIIGPAIGGVIVAAGGSGWCFLLNAFSYAVMLVALASIKADEMQVVRSPSEGSMREQLADGLHYVRGTRSLVLPLILQTFMGIFGYNFSTILPLLSRFAFDAGSVGLGALLAARGIGALLASPFVARSRAPSPRTLVIAAACFGAVLLSVGVAPIFGLGLLLIAVLGAVEVYYISSIQTTLLLEAREEYRGRVLSLNSMLSIGTTPFGSSLTGTIADVLGIRAAVVVNAACCLVGAATGHLSTRRAVRKG